MSETKSASASVTVGVDPHTAFVAFTDEMNSWWKRSPISFYDSARAVARRCEPGVGGRILEVYDETGGDALELGQITVWEPGSRLAWLSSVDDVEVVVTFEATEGGTTVRVDARVLPGGDESTTGSFSFARVVPEWFGGWCERRGSVPLEPTDLSRLNLALYYEKPVTAARWLKDVFGFDIGALPDEGEDAPWLEFHIGNGAVLLFRLEGQQPVGGPVTHMPWVYVDDLAQHFAQASACGATIVQGIHQHGYRAYVADDLEGHRWTFAQARPTMK